MQHMDPIRDLVLLVFVIVSAVMANLFAFFYSFRPWSSTQQGIALWVKALGNVVILNMALAYALFGDYPFRTTIRIFGFGIFMVGISYLTVSLLTSENAREYPPWRWLRRRRPSETTEEEHR